MTKIRTVSEAKREFYTHYTRPVSSIYRRFVEELLVEIHLLMVNGDFRYDPIFALGVVTAFDRFMQGYQPAADLPAIFAALCRAVGGQPEQYRRDAQALRESCQGLVWSELLPQLSEASQDTAFPLLQTLRTIQQRPNFKYSRLFAIGLYTLMLETAPELKTDAEQRQQLLKQLAESLGFTDEKLQKDLDLYRSNLDKVDQLLKVLEETAEAERKKREKQAAAEAENSTVSAETSPE
ncbi:photosystem II biogenesis protein Psp29 [Synechocystis sp. LKSZ1]|uniref:photosystem II biogenesis protein Psp29 n=1 Tax=Synechocystis sp. LKSZ1 TaxID=3144951 RepID=UPI00336C0DAF